MKRELTIRQVNMVEESIKKEGRSVKLMMSEGHHDERIVLPKAVLQRKGIPSGR